MGNLLFEKEIAFIDLETTGLNVFSDRIVEITILKLHPDGTEELKNTLINPGIHIPEEATRVHGIKDCDVADKPSFRQYAKSIFEFIKDCDIGGFGVKRFDLPILEAEFKRAGIEFSRNGRCIVDAQIIYHLLEPRDLSAAYKKYCGNKLENSHTSEVDARASYMVLEGQLQAHPDLPRDVIGLSNLCNPEQKNWVDPGGKFLKVEGSIIFNFGQYKGRTLNEVASADPDYLLWISKGSFSDAVRELVREALNNRSQNKSTASSSNTT